MPPVLSIPAETVVSNQETEEKLRKKFSDWTTACDHVEPGDVGDGLLTEHEKELMDGLRNDRQKWRKRVAELLPIFVAHARRLEPKSKKMWKSAKRHVAETQVILK